MSFLMNLLLGLLFGIGLVVSGMSDPAKVLNFLDLFGTWDPSLAFVMGGGVIVALVGYRLVFMRDRPLLDERFHLPTAKKIDGRLADRRCDLRYRLGSWRFLPWSGDHGARPRSAGNAGVPAGDVGRPLDRQACGWYRSDQSRRRCVRGVQTGHLSRYSCPSSLNKAARLPESQREYLTLLEGIDVQLVNYDVEGLIKLDASEG